MYAAITRAIGKAVVEINRDIRPYLKYMIREVPHEIATLTRERDDVVRHFADHVLEIRPDVLVDFDDRLAIARVIAAYISGSTSGVATSAPS